MFLHSIQLCSIEGIPLDFSKSIIIKFAEKHKYMSEPLSTDLILKYKSLKLYWFQYSKTKWN